MRIFIASMIAALSLVFVGNASATHTPLPVQKVSVIKKVYPDLWAREMRRPYPIDAQGRDKPQEAVSWNHLRKMARTRWLKKHHDAYVHFKIAELVLIANKGAYGSKQTKDANWQIIHLMWSPTIAACAVGIIGPETASTYDHRIEYTAGGPPWDYGAWRIYSGEAYGLPMSQPGTKMLTKGKDAATNPETQLKWMESYVNGRYGGMCNALAFRNQRHSNISY